MCCDASDAAALIVAKCVTVLMPILITHKNGDGMEGGYVCVLVCVRACVCESQLCCLSASGLSTGAKRGPDFSKGKYQHEGKGN